MVTAVCDRVICVQEPVIRLISGQSLSLEAKGVDASLRMSFMVYNNNYAMMYYFLRFFKAKTAHRITGALNVSAYTFDDSTKAYASIRVGVNTIEPIRTIDFAGQITGFGEEDGCVPINEETFPQNREYLKLKFIIFKYVWENWENERLVKKKEMLKESFSDHLELLYDNLVELQIAMTEACPVTIESRRIRDARGRAGQRRRNLPVRIPNPALVRTDLESVHLSLSNLLLDNVPFSPSVFFASPPAAATTTTATTATTAAPTTTLSADLNMVIED